MARIALASALIHATFTALKQYTARKVKIQLAHIVGNIGFTFDSNKNRSTDDMCEFVFYIFVFCLLQFFQYNGALYMCVCRCHEQISTKKKYPNYVANNWNYPANVFACKEFNWLFENLWSYRQRANFHALHTIYINYMFGKNKQNFVIFFRFSFGSFHLFATSFHNLSTALAMVHK